MGGANCAIVGCPAQKSKHKGLTFHKLPAKGTNDEWRMQLINNINRQDKSFNPDRATICSRHFKDSCFKTGPGGKLRRLIEGSLPTEYMPVRTIETPKPTERKPPMQREPPPETQRVCYFTLKNLRKDSTRLPAPWTRLEDEENYISVGIIDRFTVKIHVSISSDLSSTVHVLGLPAANLSRHLEQVRLHTYLQELSTLNVCTGVTNPELQDFSTSPPIAGFTDKHYLHRTHYYDYEQNNHCSKTCVRSADCLLLSDKILCKNCEAVEKMLTKQLQMSKATAARPLHAHDPLRTASKDKLKIALKAARVRERKLQKEVELFKKKLNTDSVPVFKELHDSMTSVLEQQPPSDPLARMFWEQQAKAFKTKGEKGMKWHPMMIRLALLLHSRGRAAYNTLRDTGVLKLPGESTLRDYTNCIHPTEGFHPEVLEEIKSAAKHLPDCERFVVLLHDEMSIKEDLVFDSKTDELVGFVNISQWKERPNCHTVFASHVLVFYVVGVNSSLKMSMGYFGTRTATADQIYPLFWEAVGHLEEICQLKVIASTSDKASPNQHLYQLHGRANEICHKTLNFFAPDRYIYFFSDVPHLVKTVRNNLYRSGYGKPALLWNNGKELMWQRIKDVYSGERARGLTRTKLTCDHIYLTAHSMMNVKLAAQVLSNRVGCVLEVHGGDGSSETARFILLMDRVFDCLNVRSFDDAREKRKDDLKPYTRGDDPRFQFLHAFLTYLQNWKESVRTRPGNFSAADRAKMFLTHQTYKGLVTTIKSFNEVAQYLLQHGVRFILSNKFCQDPIEAHFGRHRGISQRSENPNLYAFGYQENKIRLQRTLALTLQPKGNVEKGKRPHTEITISNSPLKKKENKLNESDSLYALTSLSNSFFTGTIKSSCY